MTLRKNIVANYIGQGWASAMGFAFLPVYIQYLGVETLGLIGLFAMMQAWFTLLDMGMTPTLSREMARFTSGAADLQAIRNLLKSLEFVAFIVAVAIGVSVFWTSGIIAESWVNAETLPVHVVAGAISVMSIVVGTRLIEGLYRGALMGLQRQVMANSVTVVISTLRHGGALAVVTLVSTTVEAFFAWQAVISVVSVIALGVAVHSVLPNAPARPRVSMARLREVRKFAGGMVGITVLSLVLTQIDKVMLSKFLLLKEFGYYTLASSLASCLYMFSAPITRAFYPRFVEYASAQNNGKFCDLFHLGSQTISGIIAPVGLVVCSFSGGIIYFWSGDADLARRCGTLAALLTFGTMLHTFAHVPYYCQLAHGWTSLAIYVNTAAIVILLPALIMVVPIYGAIGAACVWITLNVSYMFVNAHLMHKRLLKGEKWDWYVSDLGKPILAAVTVVLLSRWMAPLQYESRLEWFVFLAVVTTTTTVTAVLFADKIRPRLFAIAAPFLLRVKTNA